MFFLGGTYDLLRRYVWLHTAGFLALAMLLWLSRDHSRVLSGGYTLGLGYLVLYLAYVPGGWLRRYNRMGDYSYGLYIYAFPVQQAVMATVPFLGVLGLFLWAGALTLGFAFLSWHFLERPVLQQKDLYRRWLPGRAGSGEVPNSP